MYFNLVTVRLWSDFQEASQFEVQHLLESSPYFDLSVKWCCTYKRLVLV